MDVKSTEQISPRVPCSSCARQDGPLSVSLVHIQILRFFAATAVVIFHAIATGKIYLADPGDTALFMPFVLGRYGVDLFFVISGFIIYYSTERSNPTPLQFLRRRLERIIPVYWFLTLLAVTIAFLVPQMLRGTDWFDLHRLVTSLLFVSFTDGKMPLLYVGWSLEYEMFFYLLVGLFLFRKKDTWDAILILFSALVIAGRIQTVAAFSGAYVFLLDPIILEFAFGILAAQLFCGKKVALPGLIAVACACMAVLLTEPTHRALIIGLPSTLLVFGAAHLSRMRLTPSRIETIAGRLGDASYSIYLIQVLTLPAIGKLTARLWPAMPIDLFTAVGAAATVVAAYGLYLFVEKPALDFCRHMRAPARGERQTAAPPA
jgi:exopolysaccharide production protein ExoZ